MCTYLKHDRTNELFEKALECNQQKSLADLYVDGLFQDSLTLIFFKKGL